MLKWTQRLMKTNKMRFLIIFLLCGLLSLSWFVLHFQFRRHNAPEGLIKVFLLLGQSNMEGGGNANLLPNGFETPPENILLYHL